MRTGTRKQERGNPYENRAEEVRMVAESLKDPECRAMLYRLAETYEQMAQSFEVSAAFRTH